MNDMTAAKTVAKTTPKAASSEPKTAREWVPILARYRDPSLSRSLFELAVTLAAFVALWATAWYLLSISIWASLGVAIVAAPFLVRLFAIQHDCGHGAFFANRTLSDWVGRWLGVLTLTPYDVWRRVHSIHHSAAGNLENRGMGDIMTLTVDEYRALTAWGKFKYRLYRNPIVLFGLGPLYLYILQNRLPIGLMRDGIRYWISALGTNAVLFSAIAVILYFGGWKPVVFIFLPMTVFAGTIGIWLFYVQHQFEQTHWDHGDEWQVHDSALKGSSQYVVPQPFQWLTVNIGVHHVQHLYARIPFYRLPEVLRDHRALDHSQRLTLRESFGCVKLVLWDEKARKLISYAQARAAYGAL